MIPDNAPASATPLSWHHSVRSLGTGGVSVDREATASELGQLKTALEVLAVEAFHVRYKLAPKSGGSFSFAGDFTCTLSQACVVTLDPIVENIAETFAVTFSPASKIIEPEGKDRPILDAPDVEALSGETVEAGRVLFELLSAALDPYPRKASAEFDWQDPKSGPDVIEKLNPFAALSKLKKNS